MLVFLYNPAVAQYDFSLVLEDLLHGGEFFQCGNIMVGICINVDRVYTGMFRSFAQRVFMVMV